MESNENILQVKHYKDGEPRDKRGRWSGKLVLVRSEYYALIEEWQKRTGLKKAQFWREAVMRGAVEVANFYGIEASFPTLEEVPSVNVKPKRKFPSWLFRKETPNEAVEKSKYDR
jgi:hypothetical protein